MKKSGWPKIVLVGPVPSEVGSPGELKALYKAHGLRPVQKGETIRQDSQNSITIETHGTDHTREEQAKMRAMWGNRIKSAKQLILEANQRKDKLYGR